MRWSVGIIERAAEQVNRLASRRTALLRRAFAASVFALLVVVVLAAEKQRLAVAVFPSGAEFQLELAVTPEQHARGYMFRERVGPREGMLFLFEDSDRHAFWMKNCRVALDLIWLDETLRVAYVAADQPPCPEDGACPSIIPMRPGRYVLEVAAGTAAAQHLEPGSAIVVLADPPLR